MKCPTDGRGQSVPNAEERGRTVLPRAYIHPFIHSSIHSSVLKIASVRDFSSRARTRGWILKLSLGFGIATYRWFMQSHRTRKSASLWPLWVCGRQIIRLNRSNAPQARFRASRGIGIFENRRLQAAFHPRNGHAASDGQSVTSCDQAFLARNFATDAEKCAVTKLVRKYPVARFGAFW